MTACFFLCAFYLSAGPFLDQRPRRGDVPPATDDHVHASGVPPAPPEAASHLHLWILTESQLHTPPPAAPAYTYQLLYLILETFLFTLQDKKYI